MTSTNISRQREFDGKCSQIRQFLLTHHLGGVALSSQALFAWATAGGDNHVVLAADHGVATFLVTKNSTVVFANNIEIPRLSAEEFHGIDLSGVEFWSCPWHEDSRIPAEIQRRIGKQAWASDCGLPGSQPLSDEFIGLTYALSESEIIRYRSLGRDCSLAMEQALKKVKPGMPEWAVAGAIGQSLFTHAVRPHVILVAADERIYCFRHPIPTPQKVKKQLMAVLCGKRGGLIVSLTRMLYFGSKLPRDLRRKHLAVCHVDAAFNHATRPGVQIKNIFSEGLNEYKRHGFREEWRLHHQGGPTGYQSRSFRGTATEGRVVLNRQAFAWNPSITGTKSEDTILAGTGGIEFLSQPSSQWPKVEVTVKGSTYQRADICLT